MIGANLRFGIGAFGNVTANATKVFQCHPDSATEATVIFSLAGLGIGANIILMILILMKPHLRRWSEGLLFHQAMIDCTRSAILIPLGSSLLNCQPVKTCSLLETAFLLLVTVSIVSILTIVLNNTPVFPWNDVEIDITSSGLVESRQCVFFGIAMIWFASVTINLGPMFISGSLAANTEHSHNAPSCPLIHGPFRHYVLNALWISINIICLGLTFFHLRKLYKDFTTADVEAIRSSLVRTLRNVTEGHALTEDSDARNGTIPQRMSTIEDEYQNVRSYLKEVEREGVHKVKMFAIITITYVLFWGPLFFITLAHHPENSAGYEVTLYIAFIHASVNPLLFLLLHQGLRHGLSGMCSDCCERIARWILGSTATDSVQNVDIPLYEPPMDLPSPPDPPKATSTTSLDHSCVVPPDAWSPISRRPSLLLPLPAELNDCQISPTNSE
ncbi:PREDICTED: uncharacterized protein LOC108783304 [Cyphomyrmex costatus]|uniref:uncharacterized protein LOC108783304 n=1 Tax=Cyphomyrmex costatus TaxID=456900 RepID=UPI0008522970|nr:PREDICTED: uncharacterized protein LOC108783304 [Cyphomyrmex costatus]